jgi:hypothetical protein
MYGPLHEDSEILGLRNALIFIRDLAEEEHAFCKVGEGSEVALRHIARKAREALRDE